MRYQGGKSRIAKRIANIINSNAGAGGKGRLSASFAAVAPLKAKYGVSLPLSAMTSTDI